jgi:hypothetical protein
MQNGHTVNKYFKAKACFHNNEYEAQRWMSDSSVATH